MSVQRYAAASTVIRDDNKGEELLWITGGDNGAGWLKTSEFISLKSGSNAGPILPKSTRNHCLAKIADAPIVMMTPGLNWGRKLQLETYFFDLETRVWSLGKPLLLGKHRCSCGSLIQTGNGGGWIAVAAGGQVFQRDNMPGTVNKITTNMVNLMFSVAGVRAEDLEWTSGPALPTLAVHHASATSKLFDKFLVIGSETDVSDSLYTLTCPSDGQQCQWTTMDQTLTEGRYGHLVFIMTNSEFECFK